MQPSLVTLASAMKHLGLDYEVVVLRGATPVRVRHSRCVVLIGDQPMAPSDVVVSLATALKEPDHPGWEATCPSCGRVFLRSKPALQVHQCSTCRTELVFT